MSAEVIALCVLAGIAGAVLAGRVADARRMRARARREAAELLVERARAFPTGATRLALCDVARELIEAPRPYADRLRAPALEGVPPQPESGRPETAPRWSQGIWKGLARAWLLKRALGSGITEMRRANERERVLRAPDEGR